MENKQREIKRKDQFVLIYWKDAAMEGTEQMSRKTIVKECGLIKGISGGILVNEDKDKVTIAVDWFHEHDSFRQISSIPKSGIYKIVRYYFGGNKK
jgi:hypothetical protein